MHHANILLCAGSAAAGVRDVVREETADNRRGVQG